jgi:hypothetical protein
MVRKYFSSQIIDFCVVMLIFKAITFYLKQTPSTGSCLKNTL